ncbi:MAG: hypothetical protein Q8P20_06975 [bacterium]|nr:hypothetical protein [bacterium]
MKRIAFCIFVFLFLFPQSSEACDPPVYLKIHELAQYHLDSLNQNPTDGNLFDRIVLMHNLAFHKNCRLREQAEKLIKNNFKGDERTPLVVAYDGSLRMIKVSQQNLASNIFRSIFSKSPYDEARESFKIICQALANEPDNNIIRLLRATAAVESAEHFPEVLLHAKEDIKWLEENIDYDDSTLVFYTYLTRAKFYYKYALIIDSSSVRSAIIDNAMESLSQAGKYICDEVYRREYDFWEDKISSFQDEL